MKSLSVNAVSLLLAATASPYSFAQGFTWMGGTEPACLGYGAIVCKRSAMCVSDDAVCFDANTCNYKGFICKSKFDDLADELDGKLRQYNLLVDNFNRLNDTQNALRSCNDSEGFD